MIQNLTHPSYLKGLGAGLFLSALLYIMCIIVFAIQSGVTLNALQERMADVDVLIAADKSKRSAKPKTLAEHKSDSSGDDAPPPSDGLHVVENRALVPAPIDDLHEEVKGYSLPKISEDDRSAYSAYKKPVPETTKPMIALAMFDYGLSDQASELILGQMPDTVSLLMNPYATRPDDWREKARANGHEIWIQVFSENANTGVQDIGPQSLITRASIDQNQLRLYWNIARTPGLSGVAMFHDNSFMSAKPLFQSILKTIFDRGLGYFEINPAGPLFVDQYAASLNAPYAQNTILLSDLESNLNADLQRLEETAKSQGHAIGVLKPYPKLIKAAAQWSADLETKGFTLVPISAISDKFLQP